MFEYSFGAVPRGGGQVKFRLWAPNAPDVYLEREGHAPVRMAAVQDGFHEILCEGAPGMRYRYRLDEQWCVADPASRQQDGDVHDASIVQDTQAYTWRNNDWRGLPWKDTVLYEIHPGLAGGFRGVQEKLAELAELGVTAVELMPIGDFPGPRNWGYDGTLPYAPDCAYGTPDDLRLLIDTAHGMGMQVFLDVVYNHFGPEGNYLGVYASDFFNRDLNTPWGDGIDFSKRQVRDFFTENALYWLEEFRFDGLRLDAAHAISDRGWLIEMQRFVRARLEPGRHVHFILEHEDNAASLLRQGFDAQWNDDAHHVLHHILTGETQGYYGAFVDNPTRHLAKCLAEGFVYQGESNPTRGGRPHGEPSADLSPTAFIFFLQNHDQTGNRAYGERLSSLCGRQPRRLRAAIALQMLTPHIPMIFMGEECGSTAPFLYFTSFGDPDLQRCVREGRLKEFSNMHGRARGGKVPAVPDPGSMKTWEASRVAPGVHDALGLSWHALYKRLLDVRREFIRPCLEGSVSESVEVVGELAVLACWRMGNASRLRIHCNFSRDDIVLGKKMSGSEQIIFASQDQAGDALNEGRLLAECVVATLDPYRGAPVSAAGSRV
ncbi:MAG: malto-oligosyltrehalose trehalohydrolase [Pusillimonas sp.]